MKGQRSLLWHHALLVDEFGLVQARNLRVKSILRLVLAQGRLLLLLLLSLGWLLLLLLLWVRLRLVLLQWEEVKSRAGPLEERWVSIEPVLLLLLLLLLLLWMRVALLQLLEQDLLRRHAMLRQLELVVHVHCEVRFSVLKTVGDIGFLCMGKLDEIGRSPFVAIAMARDA